VAVHEALLGVADREVAVGAQVGSLAFFKRGKQLGIAFPIAYDSEGENARWVSRAQ
jgi:hypothetical protein